MRVVLLRNLDLREETAVQFECGREMIECLLEVTILEVCLSKLGVGCYKNEQVFLVNVHQQFAEC